MGMIRSAILRRMTAVYVALYAFFHPKKNAGEKSDTGRVMIAANGGLGDGLMAAQMIGKLIEHYRQQKKQITLVCGKEEFTAFRMTLDLTQVEYVPCNWNNYAEPLAAAKKLAGSAYDELAAILTWTPWGFVYLLTKIAARRKCALFQDSGDRFTMCRVKYLLVKRALDIMVPLTDRSSAKTELRRLAESVGAGHYKITIPYIPRQCGYAAPSDDYITICVDSNDVRRRWEIEKFIALTRRLLDRYDYDIIIAGSQLPEAQLAKVKEAFQDCGRVKVAVGMTTLPEFIELLRGSRFHVGIDSGSIHIAASVGTQAFCLTGVWEGVTYFPYVVEEESGDTATPVVIYRGDADVDELPCFACKRHGGYGHGNRACRARCEKGEPCLCLDRIEVDRVMASIQNIEGRGDK